MSIIVDFNQITGKTKPMHAVNNGPLREEVDQVRSNFEAFCEAKIPYVRNHDASFCAAYGGEHTVDIHAVFPDFSKNPYDEESYDFQLTDEYLQIIAETGAEVYYRLGSKIEHWSKKYGTIVPADFHKWAVVCEHIIRHYTEGWANGYYHKITYWEIWNEADLVKGANGDKPNWSGTPEQYYELYIEASSHLKTCFPHLKIGGPAACGLNIKWLDGFFDALSKTDKPVALDFFSWHAYGTDVSEFAKQPGFVKKYLAEKGYPDTELILNEWNYIENWTDRYVDSLEAIGGIRAAAFCASVIIACEHTPLDMLMYYDARIETCFNGMFDLRTLKPIKGYYPIYIFSKLYALGQDVYVRSDEEDVYITAATDGKTNRVMLARYLQNKADKSKKTVEISGISNGTWTVYRTDAASTMQATTITVENNRMELTMPHESFFYLTNE